MSYRPRAYQNASTRREREWYLCAKVMKIIITCIVFMDYFSVGIEKSWCLGAQI